MSRQFMNAAFTGDLKYIKSLSFKSKLFRSKPTDINAQDEHGCTALWWAARYNHVQVVKYLAQSGASVNQINQNKESPLWISSMYGLSEVVSELLQSGADPNLANGKTTPLFAAAEKNHVRVCEMLLAQQGILVDVISSGGVTALFAASQNGHLQVVQLLMSHGADPRIPKTDNRLTALHMAAQNGHMDVVRTLLQHGADINGLTKSGKTPSHLCAVVGNVEVMRLLLKHGADVNIKTDKNMRPLEFAKKNSHTELVQILAQCTTEEKLDEEHFRSGETTFSGYQDHRECKDEYDVPRDDKSSDEYEEPQYYSDSGEYTKPQYHPGSVEYMKPQYHTVSGEYEEPQASRYESIKRLPIAPPPPKLRESPRPYQKSNAQRVKEGNLYTSTHDPFLPGDSGALSGAIGSSGGEKNQEKSILHIDDPEYFAGRLRENLANRGREILLTNSVEGDLKENDLSDKHLMRLSTKISNFWFQVGVFLSIDKKELQQLSETNRDTSDMAAFYMLVKWRDGFQGNLPKKKRELRKAVSEVLDMKSLPDNVSNLLL